MLVVLTKDLRVMRWFKFSFFKLNQGRLNQFRLLLFLKGFAADQGMNEFTY